MLNIDESNFIAQIKKKNPKALAFIIDKYGNLVFKVAYSVLDSNFYSNYVEECANDVFESVWNNIDSFDGEKGDFKCWIAAVARYKAIDYRRKLFKQSTDENIEKVMEYRPLSTENSSAEDIAIMNENKSELIAMIKTMKSEDAEIFVRRYFLQETIEGIAELLGLNRNSVDKKLSRGRKYLREKILSQKGEMLG